jgi:RND family efflux transporter MFP subunit
MKYIKIISALMILLAGIFAFKYLNGHKVKQVKKPVKILPPIVKVLPLQKKNMRMTITATGTVVPLHESLIQPQVAGKIVYVSHSFLTGKIVKKNELLIKLEQKDYLTALKNAEANYAKALLNLEKVKNEAERAINEWNREKKRFKLKKPSALRMFKPQLKSAEANVKAAEKMLELARINLSRTEIKAPFKGIIREKRLDLGTFAAKGTVLGKIASIENVQVVTPVPDFDYPFIDFENNKNVEITLKLGEKTFKFIGKLDRSSKYIEPDTRMIKLYTIVKNPYQKISQEIPLFIGSFVNVKFKSKFFENIAKIPLTALHNSNEIWIAKNNKLIVKKVKIIRIDKNFAYISGDFENRALLIISNLPYISNSMNIRTELE